MSTLLYEGTIDPYWFKFTKSKGQTTLENRRLSAQWLLTELINRVILLVIEGSDTVPSGGPESGHQHASDADWFTGTWKHSPTEGASAANVKGHQCKVNCSHWATESHLLGNGVSGSRHPARRATRRGGKLILHEGIYKKLSFIWFISFQVIWTFSIFFSWWHFCHFEKLLEHFLSWIYLFFVSGVRNCRSRALFKGNQN